MSLPRADEWTDPGPIDPPVRWGRRVLLVVALLMVATVGSFLVWRGASLNGIPEVGEPFDTAKLGVVDIPDEENAFAYYRQAVAKFRDNPTFGGPYVSWSQATAHDREWLFSNAEAMELWFVGTTMDRAVSIQPKDLRVDSPRDVTRALRRLIRLAQLVGLRMEAQGNLDEAWVWYRAGLRCSRHCGKDGGFVDRLIGSAMYREMETSIRAWADHPNLSPSSLHRALDDVIAINAMTPAFAEGLRAEYFVFSRFLDAPGLSRAKIEIQVAPGKELPDLSPFGAMKEAFWTFALREPERSRRVLRLVWSNWLTASGLPAAARLRRGERRIYGTFYEPPTDAGEPIRHLSPGALDHLVGSTRHLRAILPDIRSMDEADAAEAAVRASLVVDLADQLYRREQGRPPASPEQLVGPYLKALPEGYTPR